MKSNATLPLILLISLQGLDILLHVVTGQVEPIRITSNGLVTIGAVVALMAGSGKQVLIVLAGIAYLALNIVFLIQHGIVNPATDALRIPLFGFVGVSLILLIWLGHRLSRAQPNP